MRIIPLVFSIVSGILFVLLTLIQNRGEGLSSTFGGWSVPYYSKRGFEKLVFIASFVLLAIFCISTFLLATVI